MRRFSIVVAATAALFAFVVTGAFASGGSPHFIGTPTCSKDSRTFVLTCSGKAAGLDSSVTAFLTASSITETVQCVNHGGNIAPGQGTSETGVTGQKETIAPHNGQITFSVSLEPPATPSAADAGCPNAKTWKVQVLSVTYHDVVLHIQEYGSDVLTKDFGTIDP